MAATPAKRNNHVRQFDPSLFNAEDISIYDLRLEGR